MFAELQQSNSFQMKKEKHFIELNHDPLIIGLSNWVFRFFEDKQILIVVLNFYCYTNTLEFWSFGKSIFKEITCIFGIWKLSIFLWEDNHWLQFLDCGLPGPKMD